MNYLKFLLYIDLEFIQLYSYGTTCLVCLTGIQEVPGSIPGYTLEIFLEV